MCVWVCVRYDVRMYVCVLILLKLNVNATRLLGFAQEANFHSATNENLSKNVSFFYFLFRVASVLK